MKEGRAISYFKHLARVFYHMSEEPMTSILLICVYILYDWLHAITLFALNESELLPWCKLPKIAELISGLHTVLLVPTTNSELLRGNFAFPADSLFFVAISYLLLLWILFSWICAVHVYKNPLFQESKLKDTEDIRDHVRGDISKRLYIQETPKNLSGVALYMLANVGDVSTQDYALQIPSWVRSILVALASAGQYAFFIPITTSLLTPLSCEGGWKTATASHQTCAEGPHIYFIIFSLIFTPLWLLWSLFFTAYCVNRTPDWTGTFNSFGSAHGRVGVGVVLIKFLLCCLRVFLDHIPIWAYIICTTILGFLWLTAYVRFLPFYKHLFNQLYTAATSSFVACCIGMIIATAIDDPENESGSAVLFVLIPSSIYVGFSIASIRFRLAGQRGELSSPLGVELRARYILSEALEYPGFGDALKAFLAEEEVKSLYDQVSTYDLGTFSATIDKAAAKALEEGTRTANNFADGSVDSLLDVRDNSRQKILNLIDEMEAIYKHGAFSAFPTSPLMSLMYSNFLGLFRKNRHLERVYLRLAHRQCQISGILDMDISFFIYQRIHNMFRDETTRAASSMTVDKRMTFEQLQVQCRSQVSDCRHAILEFWAELGERHPDLVRLERIGNNIMNNISIAEVTFNRLLDLAPQSTAVMRLYAGFLLEIANDPYRANEFLSDAELLEDEHSKIIAANVDSDAGFGGLINDFDLAAEGISWIRISMEEDRIGTILDTNSEFQKLFGYNRREIIGKEMSFLIPEPIATVHPLMLKRFQVTGVERVANRSRLLLAKHRSGHLFPIKINIRPSGDEVVAVMEGLSTPLAFLLFLGSGFNWRITGLCKISAAVLQTDPAKLNLKSTDGISLKSFMQEPADDFISRFISSKDPAPGVLANSKILGKMQKIDAPFLSANIYVLRFRVLEQVGTGESLESFYSSQERKRESAYPDDYNRMNPTTETSFYSDLDSDDGSESELLGSVEIPPHKLAELRQRLSNPSINKIRASETGEASDRRPKLNATGSNQQQRRHADDLNRDFDLDLGVTGCPFVGPDYNGPNPHLNNGNSAQRNGGDNRSKVNTSMDPRIPLSQGPSHGSMRSIMSNPSGGPHSPEGYNDGMAGRTESEALSPKSAFSGRLLVKHNSAYSANGSFKSLTTSIPGQVMSTPHRNRTDGSYLNEEDEEGEEEGDIYEILGLNPDEAGHGNGNGQPNGLGNARSTNASSSQSSKVPSLRTVAYPTVDPAENTPQAVPNSSIPTTGGAGAMTPRNANDSFTLLPNSNRKIPPLFLSAPEGYGSPNRITSTGAFGEPAKLLTTTGNGAVPLGGYTTTNCEQTNGSNVQNICSNVREETQSSHRKNEFSETLAPIRLPQSTSMLSFTPYNDSYHPSNRSSTHTSNHVPLSHPLSHHQNSDASKANVSNHGSFSQQQSTQMSNPIVHSGAQHPTYNTPARAQSVKSNSSHGSSVASNVLRRGIKSQSVRLETSLRTLKRSIASVFFVIAFTQLGSFIVFYIFSGIFIRDNMSHIVDNGDRALFANQIYNIVQNLQHYSEENFVPSVDETESTFRTSLQHYTTLFEDVHRKLYLESGDGNGDGREHYLYTEPVVPLYDLVPGSYVNRNTWNRTQRYANLANVGFELVSKSRLVATSSSLADISLESPPVWFIWHNSPRSIVQSFNYSMILAHSNSNYVSSAAGMANQLVAIVAELVLIGVIVALAIPSVNTVALSKHQVFDILISFRVSDFRKLRAQVQRKIDSVLQEDNGAEDHENQVHDEDVLALENNPAEPGHSGPASDAYSEGGGNPHASSSSGAANPLSAHSKGAGVLTRDRANSSGGDSQSPHHPFHTPGRRGTLSRSNSLPNIVKVMDDEPVCVDDEDDLFNLERQSRGFNCCGTDSMQACLLKVFCPVWARKREIESMAKCLTKSKRRFRNKSSAGLALLLRVIWPLLVAMGFFFACFFWRASVINSLDTFRSELLWTKQVELFLGISNSELREAFYSDEVLTIERSLEKALYAVNSLDFLQDSLMYGNPALKLRPGLQVDHEIQSIVVNNGCIADTSVYSYEECTTHFYNGIMSHGLQNGIKEYISLSRTLINKRLETLSEMKTLITNNQEGDAIALSEQDITLHATQLDIIYQMRWKYISYGLMQVAHIRLDKDLQFSDDFFRTELLVTILCVLLLTFCYVFIYEPLIRQHDKAIKKVRYLLLLLPDDMAKTSPAILAIGQELMAKDATVV